MVQCQLQIDETWLMKSISTYQSNENPEDAFIEGVNLIQRIPSARSTALELFLDAISHLTVHNIICKSESQ